MIMDCFDLLPIAALISDKMLAMHGGISPQLQNLQQIDIIERFQEIPKEGLFCDIVWSDPIRDEQRATGVEFI